MNRKLFIFSVLSILAAGTLRAQEAHETFPRDSASRIFKEFAVESALHTDLWARDLYGPLLLIDPETLQVYANVLDAEGLLTPAGDIYTGQYPSGLPIANTAIHWSGVDWATIMLPSLMPLDKTDRISLLSHESFHVIQPALGFTGKNDESVHLDGMEGRITLKLELEALKKALAATDDNERNHHLTNAFLFRACRRSLYPGSDGSENNLELNEGLAEYTGEAASGRAPQDKTAHFVTMIDRFYEMPSFVRSFAYMTIPAYGYLLDRSQPGWNREITDTTDLTAFFIRAFGLDIPAASVQEVEFRGTEYNGEIIAIAESQREEQHRQRMAEYKEIFVTEPHFDIALEAMQISFDPRNILSLDEYGTVYPTLHVKDNWGIIEVSEGALMSPQWNRITISLPFERDGQTVTGDGWNMELNEGYTIAVDPDTGNASIAKQ